MSLLERGNTLFTVIDMQEKLVPAMSCAEKLTGQTVKLVKGMKALDIPVLVTQQYTKGLGDTIPEIAGALGDFEHIEKTTFSCMANSEFAEKVRASGRKDIVICGIETHICVEQTVLQLMDEGYNVYLAADCIYSRSEEDRLWAVSRMGEAGAVISTYEAILYELLRDAKAPEFKAISAIVK